MEFTLEQIKEAIKESWENKLDLLIYPKEMDKVIVKKASNEDKAYLLNTSIWEPKYYSDFTEYRKDICAYLGISL